VRKNQVLVIIVIPIITLIAISISHYFPDKQMSAYRNDMINQILLAENCKLVEKIYNDNNSILGDGLILKYAKDRLNEGKFPHKDCVNQAWNK